MKTRFILLFVLAFLSSELLGFAQQFLDTTFDPGTGVNGFVESVLVQPDGKILICGNFTEFNGVPRSYMARLNANGSLDETFVPSPNYWVRSMALQPDGKVVIGGFFTAVGGMPRARVGRVNADGSVDTTFNPGAGCEGRIVPADPTDPFLFAVALQPDGKVIIGGNFTNYNKVARCGIARLNSDGSLDTDFNVGSGVDSWVRSILVMPNNQILLSGWFQNYNSRGHDRMVRLNPDGSSDESFKTHIGYSTSIYTMALLPDGKMIVGGHSVNTNSPFQQEVVRLNTDGSYDLSFNPGGEGSDEKVESVVVQRDGKILIGGYFSLYNGSRVKNIARLNADGTLDTDFDSKADNWVWNIALQDDDKFLIVGAFSTVDGASRRGIARLNPTDELPPPPPPPDDLVPPTVTILSPVANSKKVYDSRITGRASDDVAVTEVLYRVGSGEFLPASGTTEWTANATLQAGNNTVEVKSVDAAGNESPVVSRTFYYVPSGRLPLEVFGPGSTTMTNEQLLEFGKTYTIRAKPIGKNIFKGWVGSVTSSVPTLRFVMSSNFVLQANFMANPFPDTAGTYSGLFSSTNGITLTNAGFITVNVRSSRSYTGFLLLEGARSSFSGKFDWDGAAHESLTRRGKPNLELDMQLDFTNTLTGTVTVNGESLAVLAERADTTLNSERPKYTLLIPPAEDSTNAPGGYGHGSASVDSRNRIRLTGALADGTTIQQNTTVSASDHWPLYVSLYRGKGLLFGWLTFTNEPDSDLRGESVTWIKLPGASGELYPNGFSLNGTVVGSQWIAPHRGASAVNWTNANFELGNGNLLNPITNSVTLGNRGNFVVASSNKTTLTLVNSTGLLRGNFVHPVTGKRTTLKGALLQKQQLGAGSFQGRDQAGYFVVQPAE